MLIFFAVIIYIQPKEPPLKLIINSLILGTVMFACGCVEMQPVETQTNIPLSQVSQAMVRAAQSGFIIEDRSGFNSHKLLIKSLIPMSDGMDVVVETNNGKLREIHHWLYSKIEVQQMSAPGSNGYFLIVDVKGERPMDELLDAIYSWDPEFEEDVSIFASGLKELQAATPGEIAAAYPITGDVGDASTSADQSFNGHSTQSVSDSLVDQLSKLNDLWKSGALTDQEYKEAKAKLLAP